ncbi:NAD-P-binding protein [Irpex rosettiformis]|uniref:NAD-P-binding protein n=1 Tax=Irpex rosettiformis TaxID=378272 RepID=A0ACB8TTG3_9APHY|nr:NAD-P-binding protein [Irpex rosettiformis]
MDLLILTGNDVDEVITKFTPVDLVNLMAQVFADLAASSNDETQVSIPHRSTVVSTNHRILFMPSRLASFGASVKIVSVPTANAPEDVKQRGLPGSTAVLDERSGEVVALVNARKLTALRNAASSLLATQLMLPPSRRFPTNLVAIGAGAQISAHVSLFLSSYPTIITCTVFNRTNNSRLTTLIDSLKPLHPNVVFHGLPLVDEAGAEHEELRKAIQDANIVVTATSSTSPLFPSKYVSPGAHLCLIGSYTPAMHEIDTDLVKRASKLAVDYKQGVLVEAGEVIDAGIGSEGLVELGELLESDTAGRWVTRENKVDDIRSGDITIFKSVGVGVQDAAISHAVVNVAKEHSIGTVIKDYC